MWHLWTGRGWDSSASGALQTVVLSLAELPSWAPRMRAANHLAQQVPAIKANLEHHSSF